MPFFWSKLGDPTKLIKWPKASTYLATLGQIVRKLGDFNFKPSGRTGRLSSPSVYTSCQNFKRNIPSTKKFPICRCKSISVMKKIKIVALKRKLPWHDEPRFISLGSPTLRWRRWRNSASQKLGISAKLWNLLVWGWVSIWFDVFTQVWQTNWSVFNNRTTGYLPG